MYISPRTEVRNYCVDFCIAEWSKESSFRRLPWCVVSESRICTVEELLELLAHQLHISDVESTRLWVVDIDGSPCKRLLDCDSVTLNDLKIQQNAQVRALCFSQYFMLFCDCFQCTVLV